jgi:hypothetical protein
MNISRKSLSLQIAVIVICTVLSACDAGLVSMIFRYPDGKLPDYPDPPTVKCFWVEERTDIRKPGRKLVPEVCAPFNGDAVELQDLAYGTNRAGLAEIRSSASSREVFDYGISELFENQRGWDIEVPVFMFTKPPQPLPEELGESLVIVTTSTRAPGYTSQPDVELLLFAQESATEARLSNVVGLPEAQSEVIKLSTLETVDAPTGYRGYRLGKWNVENHADVCTDRNRCRREVFASFGDAQGYYGPAVLASVILDEVAPSLIAELTTVTPYAREETVIAVSMTASESIFEPELLLAQRADFPFVRVSPIDDAPTATYTFTSSKTAGELAQTGDFLLRANFSDLAGNRARLVEVGMFNVDTVVPEIVEAFVDPSSINGEIGRVLTASFIINKVARTTVTLGGRPMDTCTETGRPPAIRVTCQRAMRGDELPEGSEKVENLSIDAQDAAGNIARRVNIPVQLDFRDPGVFAATFTPESSGNELVQLSIISDEALEEGFVPQLVWSGLAAPFEHDPLRDGPFERYFVLRPPVAIPAGEYWLAGVGLRDEAENEAISTSSAALPRRWLFDPDAPVIENFTVAVRNGAPVIPPRVPAIAGTAIDIGFTVREDHIASVRVLLGARDITSLCSTIGAAPEMSWSCSYTTTGNEYPLGVEENESVLIEIADRSSGRRSVTAPIIWDYALPSIQSVVISPPAAGLGMTAQLTVSVSEPMAPGFEPPLSFSPPIAFVYDAGRSTAFQAVFQYSVPAAPPMPSSSHALNEVRLRDVAGNEAVINGALATFLIDNVAPQISGLTVLALAAPFPATPPRINAIPGQQIEARFSVTEASPSLVAPSVLLGAIDLSASCTSVGTGSTIDWTCRYTTTGNEYAPNSEQTVGVIVEVLDLSGNRISDSTSVVFDFLPPSIQSVVIDPAATGLGRTALLTLAASEALAPGFEPVLFWSPAINFVYESGRSTQFQHVFRYDVTAADVSGRYRLQRARLLDLAGNEATVTLAPELTWLLDNVPPVISDVTVDVNAVALNLPETTPPRINGDPTRAVRVGFTVIEENPSAGRPRLLIGVTDASSTCVSSGSGAVIDWTCLYSMTGSEAPGLQIIAIQVADLAENTANDASSSVVFDFEPPEIVAGSESFQLFPAVSNLLTRIPGPRIELGAWGVGTAAFVGMVFNEPLARTPEVSAMPSGLAFQLSEESGTAFTFERVMTSAPQQGAHRIEVRAMDAAGNGVVRTLATPLNVDTIGPVAPNTLRMTHTRVPWGSDATGNGAHALIAGDSGAVEANARVAVLGSDSLATFEVLGSALADGTGAVPAFELDQRNDRAEVFVVVLDGAGNASPSVAGDATRASRVRRAEWIASLRGKVPGRRSPNPHNAEMYTGLLPTLAQNQDQTILLSAADFERMAATDGQTLNVETVRRFEPIPSVLDQPSARQLAAMAYDTMRGRSVLFGGSGPEPVGDTWEWDGHRWFPVVGAGFPPPARSGASMAFDAARGVVVMFGGVGLGGDVLEDTWEWDGATWVEVTSAISPPPRERAAMAYDPERARIVLHGGTDGTIPLRDTWIWDGETWATEPCVVSCPGRRTEASLVWSGTRLQLMGGANGSTLEPSIWSHEIGWRLLTLPPPQPPLRRGAVVVYDPVRSAILTFGGTNGQHLPDTWMGNQQMTFGPSQDQPSARSFAASAFDTRRGEVLMFGGVTGSGVLGDTWTWDGETWRDVTPSQDLPEVREQHAMAYDTSTREVLMFGGLAGNDLLYDTWSWNGSRWKQHDPSFAPGARRLAAMSSWETGAMMFGGFGPNLINAVSSWNGADWSPIGPCRPEVPSCQLTLPEARNGHAMVHDTDRVTLTLFGGVLDDGSYDGRTWEWINSIDGWNVVSTTGPSVRGNHAMAFDAARSRTVLFGGIASNLVELGDLWEWNGTQWSQVSSAVGPSPRRFSALTYDSVRGRTVLYGGADANDNAFSDAWEWDGAQWSEIGSLLPPGARSRHQLTYDANRRRMVLFGGVDSDELTWELEADPAQRAAMQTVFDVADLTVAPLTFDGVEIRLVAGGDGSTLVVPGVGASSPGIEIGLWDAWRGQWLWLSTSSAPARTPMAFTASRAANVAALISQEQMIHVLVRSASGIGNGVEPAEVALDSLEVRISYRYPN